jgi:hypothetical protein
MIQIKKTKSVEMNYDPASREIFIGDAYEGMWIPLSKVFQVKRGLETAVQKYYRKHDKRK